MIDGSIIGVDISAPQVHVARIKAEKVEKELRFDIDGEETKEHILGTISDAISQVMESDVLGIGVGVPSIVNVEEGIVYSVSRIASWKEVHLKKYLESKFNLPAYINNDANCFATGVKHFGQGKNYKNIVGLILTDGMGAGVIVDHKLFTGANCGVGEFGKMVFKDTDYESYCSTRFFLQQNQITFEEALLRAKKGDRSTLKLFEKYGYYIGTALKSVLYTFDPELIVLGGHAIIGYPYFKDSMNLQLRSFAFDKTVDNVKIQVARQKNLGVLGAAALYLDAHHYNDLHTLRENQKKIQSALNQAEQQYYKIFNAISDPIFIIDKATDRFLDCNEAVVKRVYGYTKDELCNMTPRDLYPVKDKNDVQSNLQTNDPNANNIYTHIAKSGRAFDVEIHSDDINFQGRPATLSIMRDISDRLQLERAANQRATHASLILKVAERINSALDPDTVLREIVNSVQESFDYYGVMLLLMNEAGDALILNSIAGAYSDIFPSDLTIKYGEGMIGSAAKTRKVQMSGDVTKDPNYVQKAGEITLSELSVPIIIGDEVIGVLDMQDDKKYAFNDFDVSAAWTLSSQISIAIRNARLHQQTQLELKQRQQAEKESALRAAQAALIYEVGQRINSSLDIEQLLSEIVTAICDTFDYHSVLLMMLDQEAKRLVLRSIAGAYTDVFPSDLSLKIGQGMIGMAAKTKAIQLSNDVTKDPNFIRKVEESTKSELCVPIISGKKLIGVLDIQSNFINAFSDSDTGVAWTLTGQIATAIDNAELYTQAQKDLTERKQAEKALRQSRNNLKKAKRETDSILENVDEGLLLINRDMIIGSQYSKILENILDQTRLAGLSLIDIFASKVPEALLTSATEFLELMFEPDVDEESLASLNPLSQIEAIFPKTKVTKYLSCKFRRIMVHQKISELIVTIRDISEQVRLERKLEESQAESKRQMDWLLSILHVEPQLLKEFIDSVNAELKYIDATIRNSQQTDYGSILEKVYRSMHLIKGNASVLDLKFFVEKAHTFEEKLSAIREKKNVQGSDFVPLIMQLSDIQSTVGELNNLIKRISKIHSHFRPKRSYESEVFIKSIQNLVQTLSTDLEKQVELDHSEFDAALIPYEYKLTVREILIQLVRNAIYHGIELPEERKKKNKQPKGRIKIQTSADEQSVSFQFKDDGRGLQVEKLRQKAIKSGRWSKDVVASWNENQIIETIFTTGISTLERANLIAGRGVGLDIVKAKVERLYGQIQVKYAQNRFTMFSITFPRVSDNKVKKDRVKQEAVPA